MIKKKKLLPINPVTYEEFEIHTPKLASSSVVD